MSGSATTANRSFPIHVPEIMALALNRNLDDRFGWEIASFLLAGVMPIFGVILLGWDAYAVMFLLSWEVITTSAVLAWLFNYPERSTIRGISFVILLAPVGLLMWMVLDIAYEEARLAAMVGELFAQTWIAVCLITLYAGLACRSAMAEARVRGASIEQNNRILITWIAAVYLPFFVFAVVMAGVKFIGVWALAAVLMVKTAVDIVSVWLKRSRKRSSQAVDN